MDICIIGGSGFIGKHLSDHLTRAGHQVLVADIKDDTFSKNHRFKQCDLLDAENLRNLFGGELFDVVINLAAKTDDESDCLTDYAVNYVGLSNLMSELWRVNPQTTIFHFSTQYVSAPTSYDKSSFHSGAVNSYGLSKLISEQILEFGSSKNWVIFRPTNIWGPFHNNFPQGFWKILQKGLYVHPNWSVIRSYGSIGTLEYQIEQALKIKESLLGRTIYLGNEPIDSHIWVNAFSLAIRGKNVMRGPWILFKLLSSFGEFLKRLKINKFPFSNKRFVSMTHDFPVDMTETRILLGYGNYDLDKEIRETADWYLHDYQIKRP